MMKDLEKKRETRCVELNLDRRWLEATSAVSGPKKRWVDGTPEYSLHIFGLRKLFPDARFVHILRDVRAVVCSMLNFYRVAGTQLVRNEEEGYRYWLRTVRACVKAEQAYGPSVVHRIRYADLVDTPESAMRSLLDFLAEPYTTRCLRPLKQRINSSNVSPNFNAEDSTTNPACRTARWSSCPARPHMRRSASRCRRDASRPVAARTRGRRRARVALLHPC